MAAWLAQFDDHPRPHQEAIQAVRASGFDLAETRGYTLSRMAQFFPELIDEAERNLERGCPDGPTESCPLPESTVTLAQQIVHLEDQHERPREYVAAWLAAHGY